jgi:hypothetical protein
VGDLVAHHSGSRFVARVRGLDDQLREFELVEDALSDALTVADNTAGPNGTVMTVDERYATSSRDTDATHRTPEPTPSGMTIFAPPPGEWRSASPPWSSATPGWIESTTSPANTVSVRRHGYGSLTVPGVSSTRSRR